MAASRGIASVLLAPLLRYAARLRFPVLAALTAVLFLVDLAVPDVIPFVDELLLGLATLVLASWRKRRDGAREGSQAPTA